jgi:peptidoglycan-associated lipoprotein
MEEKVASKMILRSAVLGRVLTALCLTVVVGACSKKDVKSDEPGFNPSSEGSADGAAASAPAVDTAAMNTPAGESSAPAPELAVVFFEFDSYRLTNEGRSKLKENVEYLKKNAAATIQIEGHCDERGTTEYNLALGERRANAARDYMTKAGVDASRISVISYGKERPSDSGHDEAAWAKNRRAQFVILTK